MRRMGRPFVASDTTTAWSSCDIGIGVNSITYDNEVTLF